MSGAPTALRLLEASEGAYEYGLRNVWTPEQVYNGLRTHKASVLRWAAEELDAMADRETSHDVAYGMNSAMGRLVDMAEEIEAERTHGVTG